jgi:hypothetical protein
MRLPLPSKTNRRTRAVVSGKGDREAEDIKPVG